MLEAVKSWDCRRTLARSNGYSNTSETMPAIYDHPWRSASLEHFCILASTHTTNGDIFRRRTQSDDGWVIVQLLVSSIGTRSHQCTGIGFSQARKTVGSYYVEFRGILTFGRDGTRLDSKRKCYKRPQVHGKVHVRVPAYRRVARGCSLPRSKTYIYSFSSL